MYVAILIRLILYPANIDLTKSTMDEAKNMKEMIVSRIINRCRNFTSEEFLGIFIISGPQIFPNGKINPTNVANEIF